VSRFHDKPKWPLIVAGIGFAVFTALLLIARYAFRHLAG
jgi:hypothetical protein